MAGLAKLTLAVGAPHQGCLMQLRSGHKGFQNLRGRQVVIAGPTWPLLATLQAGWKLGGTLRVPTMHC